MVLLQFYFTCASHFSLFVELFIEPTETRGHDEAMLSLAVVCCCYSTLRKQEAKLSLG